jgi:hypothetical protein
MQRFQENGFAFPQQHQPEHPVQLLASRLSDATNPKCAHDLFVNIQSPRIDPQAKQIHARRTQLNVHSKCVEIGKCPELFELRSVTSNGSPRGDLKNLEAVGIRLIKGVAHDNKNGANSPHTANHDSSMQYNRNIEELGMKGSFEKSLAQRQEEQKSSSHTFDLNHLHFDSISSTQSVACSACQQNVFLSVTQQFQVLEYRIAERDRR